MADSAGIVKVLVTKKKADSTGKFALYNSSMTAVYTSTNEMDDYGATNLTTITFNVAAGTYYCGASADGCYIYDIIYVSSSEAESLIANVDLDSNNRVVISNVKPLSLLI